VNMRSVASTSLADCAPATSLTAQQASLKAFSFSYAFSYPFSLYIPSGEEKVQ